MSGALVARVLVYGFGPYQCYATNVTEQAIRALRPRAGVQRRVFDVRFDRGMFERTLERLRPRLVIGMGQHPRARKLRIERRARPVGNATAPRFVSLDLPRTPGTTRTYDAGDYVCNFSMWVVQGWCAENGARFAFIHVPRTLSPARVVDYLERCLSSLRTDGAARSSRRVPDRSR